ncbi:MAG: PAS domain S-box protein, partial [Acidobacteriaceae bacterium]|nr:PAS domain S-box protein [Acidobacteriaceae bacterium]
VLLDVVLPGAIDGITTAERFQQLNIPVIYITGHPDHHLFDRARQTEPLAYPTKPLKTDDLNRVIKLALFNQGRVAERDRQARQQMRQLRESEERFRRVVEQVNEYCIFTLDQSGHVSSWNNGAERILGYSADEILGRPYEVFFSPGDRSRNVPAQELEEARRRGSADNTRWLVRQSGEQYWAEGVLTAIRDADGAITGFTMVSRDTTERWRMEQALKEREERLRVALNAARTGTWKWDLRTNIDVIDDSLRKLFGLDPDQKFETIDDFYAIVHPEERAQVIESFERTLRDGVHLDTEFRVIWPNGSEHWLLDQGEVARDREGNPAYLSGACVDITQRKQVENSLREYEERFREFASNVRDYALLQLDAGGRIVSWNTGAERVLGYSEPEILGQSVAVLFTPEDVTAAEPEKEMEQAVTRGRSMDERWHVRKDGTRFWASGVLTSMSDEKGRLRGFAKVMRDETERRRSDEQLRASLHEKEILLQEIHHRVKNNLQVISSLLGLQSEHIADERTRGFFEEARNRVQAIGGIHDLLYRSPDLVHIDFGVYLNRLARDLFSFYRTNEDGLHLAIHVNHASLNIRQAIPCGLIVNELVTNCLKHAFPERRNGTITLSLGCSQGLCLLVVQDNGIGLPEGFDWGQADSLGLQLVQVLTKQLDGVLRVDRTSGTRFEVSFPHRPS